jgi:hypothetical protein
MSKQSAGLTIIAASFLLVCALLGLAAVLGNVQSVLGLPVLAIAGAVLLLGVLSLISLSFSLFDLSDRTQALALPQGSVRAVVALLLIVLFAILAIFLYTSLAGGSVTVIPDLSAPARDALREKLGDDVLAVTGPDGRSLYTAYVRLMPSPAAQDLAKQLIVLVGTLVTSIASFYFGARATASALAARAPVPEAGAAPRQAGAGTA